LVLDVFLAARKQNEAHGGGRDEGGANHTTDYSGTKRGQTFLNRLNPMRYTNPVTFVLIATPLSAANPSRGSSSA
jgi:hypothetical protein